MEDKKVCEECAEQNPSRSAGKKAKKMDCGELAEKIRELIDKEKKGRAGPKGLKQRYRDYQGDDLTHGQAYLDQQRSLQAYLNEFRSKGCGDPPDGALEWSTKPLPARAPTPAPSSGSSASSWAQKLAVAGAGATALYVGYRVLRLLPSLFAPPTLIPNLLIP